ncbi:4Fe-4S binding protein [Marinoscillum sp.]|uniref:4Fe-4S binding protein n=1 Tax=Marinoscillum sp. TaxID=2024838 RepID=UPI003BACC314
MSSYFKNIKEAVSTLSSGLKLTLRYLTEARFSRKPIGIEDESYFEVDKGIVTLEYPYESLPVPDNARYRLHNEIDDCIVCDKCAKVCPVDCIDIEAIRSPETFGVTSDGTPKRIHAAKFDIDMGKCCFCGLCTTVCPTECLTMTKVYDFSEFDINDHVYSFADMSLADIAQKRKELEAFEAKKAAEKEAKASAQGEVTSAKPKPAVRPKPVKPASGAKPAMKPKVSKPVMKPKTDASEANESKSAARPKPVMKPKTEAESSEQKASKPKPVMKPKVKPKSESEEEKKAAKPRPVMKPKIKPKSEQKADENKEDKPKPKYRPRPVIRKKPKDGDDNS